MAKEYKITAQKREELVSERLYLSTEREKEVTERIKEARSFGDLSENSEYDEARNEQAWIYGRIAEIDEILNHAVIIDETEAFSGIIGLGCRVVVRDMETDEEETFQIVGTQEANPMEGKVSDESPFGRVVIGKTAGDTVSVEAPMGTLRYEILSVER